MVLTELLKDVDVIEDQNLIKSFPTVVRMWAKTAEKAAQRVVGLLRLPRMGNRIIGKPVFSLDLLGGLLREGTRKMLHRPEPKMDIKIRTIPRF